MTLFTFSASTASENAYARRMDAIVRKYQADLVVRARRILHDDAAARDAVQETFIKALGVPNFFEPTFHRKAWLRKVVQNYCLNQDRNTKRRSEILAAQDFPRFQPPDQAQRMITGQRMHKLAQAMAELPEAYRSVLEERYLNEQSYEEISLHLKLQPGTVMSRISRGKQRLILALSAA